MLKNRIIPCLDVKNGRVVKGINFVELKDAGASHEALYGSSHHAEQACPTTRTPGGAQPCSVPVVVVVRVWLSACSCVSKHGQYFGAQEAVHKNIRCQAELQRAVRANDMDEVSAVRVLCCWLSLSILRRLSLGLCVSQMLRIAHGFGLTRDDVVANKDALEQFMAQLPTFDEILESMAHEDSDDELAMPDVAVPPGSDILSPRSSVTSGTRRRGRKTRFADEEAKKREHEAARQGAEAMGEVGSGVWSDTRAPTEPIYRLGPDGRPMGSPSPADNPKHQRISLPIPIGINKFGAHVFALDVETRDGWTALTRAAVADDVASVKDFVRLGAQIDLETRLRHTALTWAASCGHVPIARELVISGADPNRITSEGKTPLIHAASKGHAEMVVFLMEAMMVRAAGLVTDSGC